MKKHKRNNYGKQIIIALFGLISLILLWSIYAMLTRPPDKALAQPNKTVICVKSGCHVNTDADATMWVARDGVALAQNAASPTVTVWIGSGRTFEIDWYGFDVSYDTTTTLGAGLELVVPGTYATPSTWWTVASGTSNAPSLTNWRTAWDATDGVGYTTNYDAATYLADHVGYTTNFAGTLWDNGTNDGARDDGNYNGGVQPSDQDSTANTMGTDARITVLGTATGDNIIWLQNIGHREVDEKKSYTRATVTVRIADITTVDTDQESYPNQPPDQTISTTIYYNNTSSATLSNSTLRYWMWIDTDQGGDIEEGEPYIYYNGSQWIQGTLAATWRTTQETYSQTVASIGPGASGWSHNVPNANFSTISEYYSIFCEWREPTTNALIDEQYRTTADLYFYTVPTLGFWLTLALVLFIAVVGVYSGALRLRKVRAA